MGNRREDRNLGRGPRGDPVEPEHPRREDDTEVACPRERAVPVRFLSGRGAELASAATVAMGTSQRW